MPTTTAPDVTATSRALHDARGSVSAEMVAVWVLVAAVIAAVWALGIAPRIGETGEVAVDCLFGGEACDLPEGTTTGGPVIGDGTGPPVAATSTAGPSVDLDLPGIDAARGAIDDAAHPPWYRPWWMRGNDAEAVARSLDGLDGPSLDALIAELSDGELRELFVTLGRLSEADRARLLAELGAKVDLDTWRRLGGFTEVIDPDPSTALDDAARADATEDRRDWYDDLVYHPTVGDLAVQGAADDHPMAITDFEQGRIGDCYLITAMLALILEDPDLLAAMIVTNDNGTYTVTFADGTPVTVSSDTVVHPDDPSTPAFARDVGGDAAPGTELYALLLEKAYAQYHGGWGDIVGGWPAETIQEMVGGSFETIDHERTTVADLQRHLDRGQPVTIGTQNAPGDIDDEGWVDDRPAPYRDGRLAHQHAYVVTGVDTDTGEVLLMNPWEPTGDPVRLTEAEFRDAMRRVDVSTLEGP